MRIENDAALDPFRGPGRCCLCGKRSFRREPHHILATGMGSGGRIDHPFAVLSVCGTMTGGDDCHYKVHQATLTIRGCKATRADLFGIVAAREQVPHYDLENAVTLFRNMNPKLTETEIKHRLARMRPGTAKLVKVLLEAKEAADTKKRKRA